MTALVLCLVRLVNKRSIRRSQPLEDLEKVEELVRNPPHADQQFVKRAMLDAPRFAAYLEQRLGVADKPSLDFDPRCLTREGLAASRGPFEEYWEPGDRSVFLARNPQEYARTSKPTSPVDRDLALGIGMFEEDSLLAELGADWESYQRSGMNGALVPAYPLLSRLADISEDALYEPGEVDALLAEMSARSGHSQRSSIASGDSTTWSASRGGRRS